MTEYTVPIYLSVLDCHFCTPFAKHYISDVLVTNSVSSDGVTSDETAKHTRLKESQILSGITNGNKNTRFCCCAFTVV